MDHLREYLEFVLPWGGPDAVSYKCVMTNFWSAKDQKYQPFGRVAQSIEDVQALIATFTAEGKDVWIGLGTHKTPKLEVAVGGGTQPGVDRRGHLKATRTQANIARLQVLFGDVDVKGGGYPDQQAALRDLSRWCQETGFPWPSLIVDSGSGGLHLYWRMTEPVDAQDWKPVAMALGQAMRLHGLRADVQCTVDSARVLRPPNTYNHKRSPPGLVTMGQPGQSYPLLQLRQVLQKFAGPQLVGGTAISSQVGKPNSGLVAGFTAGVDAAKAMPQDMYDIADAGCGVFAESIDTNGAADGQPLWNLVALATTFDVAPRETFHAMSSGHLSYDPNLVDQMLLRKVQERVSRNLGWPSCAQFSVVSPQCQTCSFFVEGKTPFHLLAHVAKLATVSANDLPVGYWRDADGCIMGEVLDKKGDKIAVKILDYPIGEGWFCFETGEVVFEATVADTVRHLSVPSTAHSSNDIGKVFSEHGIKIADEAYYKNARNFTMKWATKLQGMKGRAIQKRTIGWSSDGFTYGEYTYSANPPVRALYKDDKSLANYMPKGDLQAWKDAAAVIVAEQRPALEAILSTCAAAALIELLGLQSSVLSAYSVESGIGKSTAMIVSQACWGHPVSGLNTTTDTMNSVMKKVGDLKSIPLMWDELKTKGEIEKMVEMVFSMAQGKGKARLNRDAKAAPIDSFSTMLVVASNDSVADMVTRATKTTEAGAFRVFEIEVPPPTAVELAARPHTLTKVQAILKKLETNYGQAGIVIAQHLAANRAAITKMVQDVQDHVIKSVGGAADERYWLGTIACLLTGAHILKSLELCAINIPALQAFLFGELQKLRSYKQQNVAALSTIHDVEELVGELLTETQNRHLLLTDVLVQTRGSPGNVNVVVRGDPTKLSDVWAQYADDGQNTRVLRVQRARFNEWLISKGLQPRSTMTKLKGLVSVHESRASLGVGTTAVVSTRSRVIDIWLP